MDNDLRGRMQSYALSRIMKHVIGFDNFEAKDYAIHSMLLEDIRAFNWTGNFEEILDNRAKNTQELMNAAKNSPKKED